MNLPQIFTKQPRPSRIMNKLSRVQCLAARFSRFYHSYPDPDDKGVTTSVISSFAKTLVKDDAALRLDKFDMKKMFPGVPTSKGISEQDTPKTQFTRLKNGLTVATQDMPGLMSSFAVIVGAGSAYETQSGIQNNSGVTQMLELTSFRSTYKRTKQELITDVEKIGGMVQCISNRENILYCIDVLRENEEAAMELLADAGTY